MRLTLAAIGAFTMMGCATIFQSSTQVLTVRTIPPGASVFIDGKKQEGVTPLELVIEKTGKRMEVTFEREGYLTESHFLKVGATWLGIIDWIPLIPGLIDLLFVNASVHKPTLLNVPLRPMPTGEKRD